MRCDCETFDVALRIMCKIQKDLGPSALWKNPRDGQAIEMFSAAGTNPMGFGKGRLLQVGEQVFSQQWSFFLLSFVSEIIDRLLLFHY